MKSTNTTRTLEYTPAALLNVAHALASDKFRTEKIELRAGTIEITGAVRISLPLISSRWLPLFTRWKARLETPRGATERRIIITLEDVICPLLDPAQPERILERIAKSSALRGLAEVRGGDLYLPAQLLHQWLQLRQGSRITEIRVGSTLQLICLAETMTLDTGKLTDLGVESA